MGTVASVSRGEWLTADGEWTLDPRHGRQFKAKKIRLSQPDTLEGIERYLGSGMISGIGKKYAHKLVERFGRDIFDVIEHSSAKLEKLEGIGPVRRKSIKEAWEEQKSIRRIMTFLFSHGVSTVRAFRIYKVYGEEAIESVQRNPYCLARDIRGIGFKIADQIAMTLGIEMESELRAEAGVEYVLGELTREGHCAYPHQKLIERTIKLLTIPEKVVEKALANAIASGRLINKRDSQGRNLIYLARYYFAERDLAQALRRLQNGKHPCPPIDTAKALQWVQEKVDLDLTESQQEALKTALTKKMLVVTGGPGVGKTTLVNSIVKILRAKRVDVSLCAPTGRAAKRLSETTGLPAKTIHRLLGFNPGKGGFQHNAQNPLDGDVFIIDETSMLDVELAAQLSCAIPAGGAMLWVGDSDQLPSVGPGCVLRDLIDSGTVPVVHLDTIFRQAAQSRIVMGAHQVNSGQIPQSAGNGEMSDLYFIESEDPARGVKTIEKLITQSIPRKFKFDSVRDIQVISPMIKGELGVRNLNAVLQARLNPKGAEVTRYGLTYRVGDKVMQIENNYDKEVFNGDIGQIESIDFEMQRIWVVFDERKVDYDIKELDELMLSYACTIHKSQGNEYPCAIIPIHTQHYVLLQRNLLYTAMTRARNLAILVGTKKALGIAVNRADAHARITTLSDRLRCH